MKCIYCGEELKDGSMFCSRCGKEVQIVPDYNIYDDDYLKEVLVEENSVVACFKKGVKVLTNDGYVDIDNIKVDDLVMSYNFDTNSNEYY